MFWERFYELCTERGTKPNPVAKELGISSGAVSKWKNTGIFPTCEMLISIADYFACSLDYLAGRSSLRDIAVDKNEDVGGAFTEDEIRIIEKYRTLDKDGMDAVRGVLLNEQRRVESEFAEKGTGKSKIG